MARMNGIACAGNWIVDQIKIIDTWPEQGELVNISAFELGIGGSSPNVLTDLASLGFPADTLALGCVGQDEYGTLILDHCAKHGIDTSLIHVMPGESTSYTDVMTVAATGARTFFQYRGANALFTPEKVDLERLAAAAPRIFHLGYLLLLDGMDAPDPEFDTAAARLLHDLQLAGIQTSIDVVSEAGDRFGRIVGPALGHTDHCIINEYEAQRITGITVRTADESLDHGGVEAAAVKLLEMGVARTAVIHCPEGGQWADAEDRRLWMPSLRVPSELIVSAVGAGDAFCAGVLYGIHDDWEPERCLTVGNAAAAMCLCAKNTTDGVGTLEEVTAFAKRYAR